MERSGVAVSASPPDMVATIDTAAKAVWAELTGKVFSKAELELVLKHRDDFRAKQAAK